jgi:hypothetical protein
MKFEDLQNQWQKEGGNAAVQINYDILLKEIKRNKNYFDAMIFWRDMREIIVGIALIIIFIVTGVKSNSWPSFFMSGCVLFICLFLLADRFLHQRKHRLAGSSIRDCVKNSLAEVNHQIWLLRNVFWWYLLPVLLGVVVFNGYVIFSIYKELHIVRGEIKTTIAGILYFLISFLITAAIFGGIYWLNQYAVKKELLPRKQELEDLLCSINDSGGSDAPTETANVWPVVFLSLLISLIFSMPLIFLSQTIWLEDAGRQIALEITPPLSPQEAVCPNELKILSAQYGAKDRWVDVTQKVADAVHGNTLSIHSGNELAGEDPLEGYTKTLEIECLWDGQKKTIRVREGTDLKIPFDANPNTVQTDKSPKT